MYENWWDEWVELAVIVVVILALVFLMALGFGQLARVSCFQRSEAMGLECRWGYFTGCLIKTGDIWLSLGSYTGMESIER